MSMLFFVFVSVIVGLSVTVSENALASSGGAIPEFVNYYHLLLGGIGFDAEKIVMWEPVAAGAFSLIVITAIGIWFRGSVVRRGESVFPDERFSFGTLVEMLMDVVYGLGKDFCGLGFKKHLPLLGGLFLFILVSNSSGLVPGFPPATENMNTNLAMGLTVFFSYNYAGIREHGAHYIKQFLGPVVVLAPLFFVIELISHSARPFSLSLRLMGNIFGDHLILTVFTGLTYVVVPAMLLFFGLLVAVVQSFVFTLLSSLYVSMAISHDH
jgi:F-type H+-transporting ATPase subunit a